MRLLLALALSRSLALTTYTGSGSDSYVIPGTTSPTKIVNAVTCYSRPWWSPAILILPACFDAPCGLKRREKWPSADIKAVDDSLNLAPSPANFVCSAVAIDAADFNAARVLPFFQFPTESRLGRLNPKQTRRDLPSTQLRWPVAVAVDYSRASRSLPWRVSLSRIRFVECKPNRVDSWRCRCESRSEIS